MLSKLANVPTIPYETMEFWNVASANATGWLIGLTFFTVVGIVVFAIVQGDLDTVDYAFYAVFVGLVIWAAVVLTPYVFIGSEYLKDRTAENLTELEYAHVRMDGFNEFTAIKDGKFVTGQLVDTPEGDAYYVIELSSVKVE